MNASRARAWRTRRAKYGPSGHSNGAYKAFSHRPRTGWSLSYEDAMRAIDAGKHVRRACWAPGVFAARRHNGRYVFTSLGFVSHRIRCMADDKAATDWEVLA